jgi:hypothetical protein
LTTTVVVTPVDPYAPQCSSVVTIVPPPGSLTVVVVVLPLVVTVTAPGGRPSLGTSAGGATGCSSENFFHVGICSRAHAGNPLGTFDLSPNAKSIAPMFAAEVSSVFA